MSIDMTPETKVQRAMIEQKRDQFKQAGFDSFLEALAAEAQDPGPGSKAKAELAEHIKGLNAKSANAYAAAKRMQAMLDELPDEAKEVEADAD